MIIVDDQNTKYYNKGWRSRKRRDRVRNVLNDYIAEDKKTTYNLFHHHRPLSAGFGLSI